MLSYADAAQVVAEHARACAGRDFSVEQVALLEGLGRVVAEPVLADRDQPPFSRSTRDGFACRAEDLKSGEPLKILGLLRSGQSWTGKAVQSGEAIEIMTGAPVPEGADCVVMVEHAMAADGFVRPAAGRGWIPGENIVVRGAEAAKGGLVLRPGTRIGAQQIAIAAACGYERLRVFARPRVAVLATGDELVAIGEKPLAHQIRNSNSYSLAAQVVGAGAEPVILEPAPDVLEALYESIERALECDLILLSGGVSMGKYDFVEQALANRGAEFFFTGARIQPGKPVVFGRLPVEGGFRYFFALPGNPVSTMVTFALFAGPLLGALSGQEAVESGPDFRVARLEAGIEAKPGLTRFLPARASTRIDGVRVALRPWQGSGDIAAAAAANCFVVVPDGVTLAAGDAVTVLHL